jgi:glutaredoxin
MPAPLPVTLYRRDDCGLCDEAEAMLARIARRRPLAVTLVDIESDDGLLRRYMLEIPVVAIGGREIARAPLYERALEDALRAAAPVNSQSTK